MTSKKKPKEPKKKAETLMPPKKQPSEKKPKTRKTKENVKKSTKVIFKEDEKSRVDIQMKADEIFKKDLFSS